MTEENQNYNTIAPLRNVAALMALTDRIHNRAMNLPGMGTFSGYSGYGKSMAATHVQIKFDAIYIEVDCAMTQKSLCQTIVEEMGLKPKGSVHDLLKQICEFLTINNVPLLVDEADHLVRRKMVEIVRHIHDKSNAAVILIGEEELPQKIRAWERLDGRMLDRVQAQPGSLEDLGHLVPFYCPGVEPAEDLRQAIYDASKGSVRRMSVNLHRAGEIANVKGKRELTLRDWGNKPFFTGDAPEPRRAKP